MPTVPYPTIDVGQAAPTTYPIEATEAVRRRAKQAHPFEHLLAGCAQSTIARLQPRDRIPEGNPERESPYPIPVGDLARWFRPENPACLSGAVAIRSPLRLESHLRVLVGAEGGTLNARIQIHAGQLAGSEIHLAMTGNRLEAQLLTRNEASRQTLVAAMDAVRENLRLRAVLVETVMVRQLSGGPDRDPLFGRAAPERRRRDESAGG